MSSRSVVAGWSGGSGSAVEAGVGRLLVAAVAAGDRVELGVLRGLEAVDPQGLGGDDRVELVRALERVKALAEALQQRALASVVEATVDTGVHGHLARHEVGAALRLSPETAWRRTRTAAALVGRLPDTLSALRAGRICYLQAAALVEAVAELPDAAAAAVQARVLARAGEQTLAETKRATARAVAAVDPAGFAARHERARRGRGIERSPLPEAMVGWWVTMPAPVAAGAWSGLSQRARAAQAALREAGETDPGLDALRVDVLAEALTALPRRVDPRDRAPGPDAAGRDGTARTHPDGTNSMDRVDGTGPESSGIKGMAGTDGTESAAGGLGSGWLGPLEAAGLLGGGPSGGGLPRCRCGGRQTAAVVVDLPTALALADNPGELPGYGPIPGPLARRMAAERDWVRWTTDPGTRRLLDRGAARYRPSGALRAFLAARDRVCGFPGCARAAERCDTDHVVVHRRGGRTVRVNLGPLCRTHHNAKTHGGWHLHYDPHTGDKTWTSPLGKRYHKATDPVLE